MKRLLVFAVCAVLLAACGTLTQTTDSEGNTSTTYTPPSPEQLQAQIAAAQVAVQLASEAIEAYNNAQTAEEQHDAEAAYERQTMWISLANAWITANGGQAVEVPELSKSKALDPEAAESGS